MKKTYVRPQAAGEIFEVSEAISACGGKMNSTFSVAGVSTASVTSDSVEDQILGRSFSCTEPFHTETVTFGLSDVAGFYNVYNSDGQLISTAHYESSTNSMVWLTIKADGIEGTEATTTHHAGLGESSDSTSYLSMVYAILGKGHGGKGNHS